MKFILSFFVLISIYTTTFSQEFITEIDDRDIGVILRSPSTVVLQSGDTLKGEIGSASLTNGYLKTITLKMDDGSKRKLQAAEMSTLWVKASKSAKGAMKN